METNENIIITTKCVPILKKEQNKKVKSIIQHEEPEKIRLNYNENKKISLNIIESSIIKNKVYNIEEMVKIIKRFINYCNNIYSNLNNVNYNKSTLNYYSINSFHLSPRSDNDKNNKIRENVIGAIINNKIPNNYYKYSIIWKKLKDNIDNFITDLCKLNNLINQTQKCFHKAGRKNNYDLSLVINECRKFNIEIKFNAQNINETPQFVSPMKPSQYLETSYEEYYYDNYLILLSNEFNLPLPDKKNIFIQYTQINQNV